MNNVDELKNIKLTCIIYFKNHTALCSPSCIAIQLVHKLMLWVLLYCDKAKIFVNHSAYFIIDRFRWFSDLHLHIKYCTCIRYCHDIYHHSSSFYIQVSSDHCRSADTCRFIGPQRCMLLVCRKMHGLIAIWVSLLVGRIPMQQAAG